MKDNELLISAIKETSFFKESIRNAWSADRMFKKEEFLKRDKKPASPETDTRALIFEEWWTRKYGR